MKCFIEKMVFTNEEIYMVVVIGRIVPFSIPHALIYPIVLVLTRPRQELALRRHCQASQRTAQRRLGRK